MDVTEGASAREFANEDEWERAKAVAGCRRHLDDLKRSHGRPPPDVPLREGVPVWLRGEDTTPRTSPAHLCAQEGE